MNAAPRTSRSTVRTLVMAVALVGVVAVTAVGLHLTGGPGYRRAVALDARRVHDLDRLAAAYHRTDADDEETDGYDGEPPRTTDPLTHVPYTSHAVGPRRRAWCATFQVDTRTLSDSEMAGDVGGFVNDAAARHPSGPFCLVYSERRSGGGYAR